MFRKLLGLMLGIMIINGEMVTVDQPSGPNGPIIVIGK